MRHRRSGYTLFQVLVLLAFLLLLLAMLLPAVQRVRFAAARMTSQNNLKQIAIAAHNYESANANFPPGVDAQNISGLVYLLPYIEQDNLFRLIDLTKGPDHADNATSREAMIKVFLSPLDDTERPDAKSGPTSYFLVAGSKNALEDNDGIFFRDSKMRIADILDGTSNTLLTLETLRGDGAKKASTVRRQHVRLKKEDLKGLADTAGVKDFQDGKNIAANRGSSWMDGRFLQSTINLTRTFDDTKPDVDCGGDGGLAGARSTWQAAVVGMADASVRVVTPQVKLDGWKALATRGAGDTVPADF